MTVEETVVEALRANGPLSTRRVAEITGLSVSTAYRALNKAEARGDVKHRKVLEGISPCSVRSVRVNVWRSVRCRGSSRGLI